MTTSIEGRQGRPLCLDMFADIAPAQVVGYDENGLLFDGALTDAQVLDIWWRWTTTSDEAETTLRDIAALRLTDTTASPLAQRIAAYLLGES